jgi:hypothetical protein
MAAIQYGERDFRSLAAQFAKPATAVAIGFAADPFPGLRADRFEGRAVEFVGMVTLAAQAAETPVRAAWLR